MFCCKKERKRAIWCLPGTRWERDAEVDLFMKCRFRNPIQNVVWFHCNSLIKKPYCIVGWDAVLCVFRLVPDVSDARINATLINFLRQMGRYITYMHFRSHTNICMCVSYTRTRARTHTHTHIRLVSREHWLISGCRDVWQRGRKLESTEEDVGCFRVTLRTLDATWSRLQGHITYRKSAGLRSSYQRALVVCT